MSIAGQMQSVSCQWTWQREQEWNTVKGGPQQGSHGVKDSRGGKEFDQVHKRGNCDE